MAVPQRAAEKTFNLGESTAIIKAMFLTQPVRHSSQSDGGRTPFDKLRAGSKAN